MFLIKSKNPCKQKEKTAEEQKFIRQFLDDGKYKKKFIFQSIQEAQGLPR